MRLAGRVSSIISIVMLALPVVGDECDLPDVSKLTAKYPKAHDKCVHFVEQTDDCCRNPKKSGCGYFEGRDVLDRVNPPREGPSGVAINETKTKLKSANEIYKSHAACAFNVRKTTIEKFQGCDYYGNTSQDAEEKKQTLELNEEVKKAYKKPVECLKRRADLDVEAADKALNSYYSSTTNGIYKFNCVSKKYAGEDSKECYLLDVSQTGGEYKSLDEAPVTTGRTTQSGCTALMGYNTSSISDHCRDGSNATMEVNNGRETKVFEGTNGKALPFESKNGDLPNGRFDDLRVFKTDPNEQNKPHFLLGVSEYQEGCKESGFMVQCSTKALMAYNGNAMVQGYPITHYPANADGTFNAPSNVLVTRGPAFYDGTNQNFYVNAYSFKGNSGGPVVIPAGTEIGGLVLSRPLVVGNVSGYTYNGSESSNPANNRTMTVVPVYSVDRVAMMYIQSVPESLLKSGGGVFK